MFDFHACSKIILVSLRGSELSFSRQNSENEKKNNNSLDVLLQKSSLEDMSA
jgi:hypothetical protein